MISCASAEASSAWLKMSTRADNAACMARAANAANALITANAMTTLVTVWA